MMSLFFHLINFSQSLCHHCFPSLLPQPFYCIFQFILGLPFVILTSKFVSMSCLTYLSSDIQNERQNFFISLSQSLVFFFLFFFFPPFQFYFLPLLSFLTNLLKYYFISTAVNLLLCSYKTGRLSNPNVIIGLISKLYICSLVLEIISYFLHPYVLYI